MLSFQTGKLTNMWFVGIIHSYHTVKFNCYKNSNLVEDIVLCMFPGEFNVYKSYDK